MSKFRIKPVAACCAILGVVAAAVQAQPQIPPQAPQSQSQLQPPPLAPRPVAAPAGQLPDGRSPEQTVRGEVRSFLLTPAGEASGLLLADGTQVEVPPHLSAMLIDGVRVRDRVEVTGVRAPGSPLVRAMEIKDQSSSHVVRVDGPPVATPPAQAAAAPALKQMVVTGRIAALLYMPPGDVGGVLMQDGTQVRFPPAADAGRGLAVGQPLYARGFGTQGPQGRAMEATAVGSSADNAQAVFNPPAPRPGALAAPGRPGAGGPPEARTDIGPVAARPPLEARPPEGRADLTAGVAGLDTRPPQLPQPPQPQPRPGTPLDGAPPELPGAATPTLGR